VKSFSHQKYNKNLSLRLRFPREILRWQFFPLPLSSLIRFSSGTQENSSDVLASNFSFSSNPLATYDSLYSFLLESILSLFSTGLPPSRKKVISCARNPAPWWNDLCTEAVEHRRSLLRIYKSSPTLDNWSAYRRESLPFRRVFRQEKLLGWKRLCAEFTHKTPTA